MPKKIEEDLQDIKNILDKVVNEAMLFFDELDSRPAAVNPKEYMHEGLPTEG